MRARRVPLRLMAPVSLVVLVAALGVLQYRWVGQVSEAERGQLRQSLDRRAREFADDFDREIGRAYQVFRPGPGFTPDAPERFAQQYDEWQSTSRFARMLKSAYFASPTGLKLFRYRPEARTFEPVEWPASLESVRRRLAAAPPSGMPTMIGGPNIITTITASPVMPEVPALLISEAEPVTALTNRSVRMSGPTTSMLDVVVAVSLGRHIVLELDRDFISSTMLPALADLHFPETGADRFRVSVVDAKAVSLLSRGLPAGQAIDPQAADAKAMFFGLRLDLANGSVSAGSPPAAAGAITVTRPDASKTERFSMVIERTTAGNSGVRAASGAGWTLLLQHAAGSLDAAVARARSRNLWLSFGILGVLAASAGLVLVNARRSEQLAAQQMDFVATVSHELRTPLAVIRSAAQNLSAGVIHEPDQARRYGELIESEGRRLTDMVEQVLEYAGLSGDRRPPASRPVDAAALVREVLSASASLPEAAGVQVDVRVDDPIPAVMADEEAIRRALHNLIGNALKHGGDGRWIGVSVERGSGRDEGQVLVSVADRGRGIPAAELAKVFDAFFRGRLALERQIRGNGLGLNLVKRIAEAHGGRVTVKSAPDQGSTFTLHLPVASSAVAGGHSA